MSDDKIWFLNTVEGQKGPFSVSELRSQIDSGAITPEWYVWREGLAEWQMISSQPELSAPAAPPPPPPAPPKPPAAPAQPAAPKKAEPAAPAKAAKAEPVLDAPPSKAKPRISKGMMITMAVVGIVAAAVGGTMFMAPDVFQIILQQVGLVPPPPPPVVAPPPPVQLGEPEEEKEVDERDAILRGYYEILKERGGDYEKTVAVLQHLWADRLEKENSEASVVMNLDYFGKEKEPMGKLDIVLMSEEKEEVAMICEVKLVSEPEEWVDTAAKELNAFRDALKGKKVKKIVESGEEGKEWSLKSFGAEIEYQTLGSTGSVEAGFDQEFDLTREEGETLQKWLLGDGPPENGGKAADSEAAAGEESSEEPSEGDSVDEEGGEETSEAVEKPEKTETPEKAEKKKGK